jgi:hypothetical protein
LPESSEPLSIIPTKSQITLTEFLRRAANEDLAKLLAECEENQSEIEVDPKDNTRSVGVSEVSSQINPLVSYDAAMYDQRENDESQQSTSTKGSRIGHPRGSHRQRKDHRITKAKPSSSRSSIGQKLSNPK